MNASAFIKKLTSFKLHGSQDKAILLIDGKEFRVTEVNGMNPIEIYTKPITDESKFLNPYRILLAADEYQRDYQRRVPNEDIPVIVRKYEGTDFMSPSRTLTITSVESKDRTLIIKAHYLDVGDHVLLSFDGEYYSSMYISGTIHTLYNKYKNSEVFTLKNGFYANSDGSIDVSVDNILVDENDMFLFEQSYRICKYFSEHEWIDLQKQINIHNVLKENLPFLREDYMKKLLDELIKL